MQFLLGHAGSMGSSLGSSVLPPPAIRVPFGVALVVWAAVKDRREAIPLAMLLCSPVLWLGSFTLLVAVPRIRLDASESAPANTTPGVDVADPR